MENSLQLVESSLKIAENLSKFSENLLKLLNSYKIIKMHWKLIENSLNFIQSSSKYVENSLNFVKSSSKCVENSLNFAQNSSKCVRNSLKFVESFVNRLPDCSMWSFSEHFWKCRIYFFLYLKNYKKISGLTLFCTHSDSLASLPRLNSEPIGLKYGDFIP